MTVRELVNPLAVDTENTGLRPYQGDRNIMASFADDSGHWAERPADAGDRIREAIYQGRTIVMHNGIYDRQLFEAEWNITVPDDQYYDTQAIDWLLDENRDHRLKEGLGKRIFGHNAQAEKDAIKAMMRGRNQADVYRELRTEVSSKKSDENYESAADTKARAKAIADGTKRTWADLTYDELHDYAVQDASLTWRILWHQQEELKADPYVHPYVDRIHDICSLAHRINSTGICVSEERAVEGLESAQARIRELEGPFEGVNMKSPTQVGKLLYDDWGLPCPGTTKSGNRSTDKDALEANIHDPRVEGLLEFRQLAKQVDAYFMPLLDRLSPDGRIHPSLTPMRTVTGRFSCSGPNLQTIPREATSSEIRKVFRPAQGLVLTEWDLSQIEVRVAADMANEKALLDVYAEGGDVYQSLADRIGVPRHVAKTAILSAQYGIGAKTLSQNLARGTGTPPNKKAARLLLNQYWQTYPQLERLMNGLEGVAKRRGYLPLWKPGRRRLFRSPDLPWPKWYTALNAAIQGGAAEFLKDVLFEIEPEFKARGWGQIVLTVHDSFIGEHEPGCEAEVDALLEEITYDVTPYKIATPWERKGWDE